MTKIIFFGNGPLADNTLKILDQHTDVIFHAHTKDDLAAVAELKRQNPDAYGVLASFGVLIKRDLLELFEPEGILNLHPSKLPQYRGAAPIETAILDGATDFSYSIMKLVRAMDAGPIYHQATLHDLPSIRLSSTKLSPPLALNGSATIYRKFVPSSRPRKTTLRLLSLPSSTNPSPSYTPNNTPPMNYCAKSSLFKVSPNLNINSSVKPALFSKPTFSASPTFSVKPPA